MVGQGAVVDVEEEHDRWLHVNRTGSQNARRDTAAFAERQLDPARRERAQSAIEGKGAFSRFRALLHAENLSAQLYTFATDRQMGRAREFLAVHGIRAT